MLRDKQLKPDKKNGNIEKYFQIYPCRLLVKLINEFVFECECFFVNLINLFYSNFLVKKSQIYVFKLFKDGNTIYAREIISMAIENIRGNEKFSKYIYAVASQLITFPTGPLVQWLMVLIAKRRMWLRFQNRTKYLFSIWVFTIYKSTRLNIYVVQLPQYGVNIIWNQRTVCQISLDIYIFLFS